MEFWSRRCLWFVKNLEIETTVQYKGIEWEDIVASGVTVDLDSSGTELYFGLNYKL